MQVVAHSRLAWLMSLSLGASLALGPRLEGQQSEQYSIHGDEVAIYNLAGTVTVEPGPGPGVTAQVTRGGTDAAKLKVLKSETEGRQSLRIVYPADRIQYPAMADGSTQLRVKGDGTFNAAVAYKTVASAYHLVAADFNGDARPDLAVGGYNANGVSILLGKGDGTFLAPTQLAATNPGGMVVLDGNGDGKRDLAVSMDSLGQVGFLRGNGDGTFQPVVGFAAGGSTHFPAAGDWNGDGKIDLAVSNWTKNAVTVLRGGRSRTRPR